MKRPIVLLAVGAVAAGATFAVLGDDGGSSSRAPITWEQTQTLVPEAAGHGGARPGGDRAETVAETGAAAPVSAPPSHTPPAGEVGPAAATFPGSSRYVPVSAPPQPPSPPLASPPVSAAPVIDAPASPPGG